MNYIARRARYLPFGGKYIDTRTGEHLYVMFCDCIWQCYIYGKIRKRWKLRWYWWDNAHHEVILSTDLRLRREKAIRYRLIELEVENLRLLTQVFYHFALGGFLADGYARSNTTIDAVHSFGMEWASFRSAGAGVQTYPEESAMLKAERLGATIHREMFFIFGVKVVTLLWAATLHPGDHPD